MKKVNAFVVSAFLVMGSVWFSAAAFAQNPHSHGQKPQASGASQSNSAGQEGGPAVQEHQGHGSNRGQAQGANQSADAEEATGPSAQAHGGHGKKGGNPGANQTANAGSGGGHGHGQAGGPPSQRGDLPPGLAKRGGDLPPGLAKYQSMHGGQLPPGLEKRAGDRIL